MYGRDVLLWLIGHKEKEEVVYMTYGYGMVFYALTQRGAQKLLEPFRSGEYLLDAHIDRYLFDQQDNYWHMANMYTERRYPLIHNDKKFSVRNYVNRKKG